ncbi:RNA-binding protein [Bacillus gobiensis]|uniref:YlmH family RNA-binding protein n=1 Tax=Bacillus gobiensis TaxID=1441095 RepID=UPI003D1E9B8A
MDNLYQHFRKEEQPFIDQALEWKSIVTEQYRPKLTDFLDPRERDILSAVIGGTGEIQVEFFGGFEESERKRALLYPEYYRPEQEDFQLQAFEVIYPEKFTSIGHRQLLGSLMGLGLKREKFGDLLISGETVQFICAKEISSYVHMQFTQVGKTKVTVKEISLGCIQSPDKHVERKDEIVSSLRLDVVCSAMIRQSRQKSQALIKSGAVKVNWRTLEDPSFTLEENDYLSVRGYGRYQLTSIEGKTKKDKWKLSIEKQL